jgi:hypothetical protein
MVNDLMLLAAHTTNPHPTNEVLEVCLGVLRKCERAAELQRGTSHCVPRVCNIH